MSLFNRGEWFEVISLSKTRIIIIIVHVLQFSFLDFNMANVTNIYKVKVEIVLIAQVSLIFLNYKG